MKIQCLLCGEVLPLFSKRMCSCGNIFCLEDKTIAVKGTTSYITLLDKEKGEGEENA